MNSNKDLLIKKAFANPRLRQNIVNKGIIYLYCDYSGFFAQNNYAVACCFVYNRNIKVTAKRLEIESERGSNYGELLAILYSLEILSDALTEHQPKLAYIYTDFSRIEQVLSSQYFSNLHYEQVRNEIVACLNHIHRMYPLVNVKVKYIGKHKHNNSLHRMAHNASRLAAME
ncbi:hypothetical protein [Paenibacillus sp. LHD-38]|uniref:hypothetical protein n=1 Tax=Paenibacillus sp. LHD-38 TaxID=3072143 RepID=UPI00280F1047|nr:hypothetical protein [Paenibacillus sp. LHD-38]MDQ8733547.1 hypothetical protein [Paenibacillus sp. LHD-38]